MPGGWPHFMGSVEILKIYRSLLASNSSYFPQNLKVNFPKSQNGRTRPNSVSIEDAFFGDSGKGRVVAELNHLLGKKKKIYSLRYNGGANAGHECLMEGKVVNVHQLPMAIIQEGAVAIIGRGMVIHPNDLLTEVGQISEKFGGSLPGKLIIDERVLLSLDTHRALEATFNQYTTGGRGSTGRGIAAGYASFYERIVLTMKDLMADNWKEQLRQHYRLYQKLIKGFKGETGLEETPVAAMDNQKWERHTVGTEKEFLKRLSFSRGKLKKYVSAAVFYLLGQTWGDPKIPFTIEGAQGAGLDPYHGVYPDVTASRPMSRNINDSTYNVILPEEIFLKLAAMKTTYLSSVGQRRLPTVKDESYEKWVQKTFDERGRSTGRLRDIYPISLPIADYLKRAAGYQFLVATHLDASQKDKPIRVITHYTEKKTGKEAPYLPYQDYLDKLEAHLVEFPGWDGQAVKKAQSPKDLPRTTRLYLEFLNQTIAPVALGTGGPEVGSYLSWLADF